MEILVIFISKKIFFNTHLIDFRFWKCGFCSGKGLFKSDEIGFTNGKKSIIEDVLELIEYEANLVLTNEQNYKLITDSGVYQ